MDNRKVMSVEIKLFANLRKLYKKEARIVLSGQQSIREVLERLTIPEEKVAIIFVNGTHAGLEDTVSPGDSLALFPPIGGG